ncbi:hypothetical protein XELAEV_18045193mg [Xenopus laevis]|uniref:Uncharacterized protein n=1 Tax=Xenopus laevis TaxID=8355 RepID=A0A974C094_XENLA|nr:hypothetical protein XELAEV_18045193mg [Xenopus laevis]
MTSILKQMRNYCYMPPQFLMALSILVHRTSQILLPYNPGSRDRERHPSGTDYCVQLSRSEDGSFQLRGRCNRQTNDEEAKVTSSLQMAALANPERVKLMPCDCIRDAGKEEGKATKQGGSMHRSGNRETGTPCDLKLVKCRKGCSNCRFHLVYHAPHLRPSPTALLTSGTFQWLSPPWACIISPPHLRSTPSAHLGPFYRPNQPLAPTIRPLHLGPTQLAHLWPPLSGKPTMGPHHCPPNSGPHHRPTNSPHQRPSPIVLPALGLHHQPHLGPHQQPSPPWAPTISPPHLGPKPLANLWPPPSGNSTSGQHHRPISGPHQATPPSALPTSGPHHRPTSGPHHQVTPPWAPTIGPHLAPTIKNLNFENPRFTSTVDKSAHKWGDHYSLKCRIINHVE